MIETIFGYRFLLVIDDDMITQFDLLAINYTSGFIPQFRTKPFPLYYKLRAIFIGDTQISGFQADDLKVKGEDIVEENQIILCLEGKELHNHVESKVANQGINASNDTMSKVATQMKDLPRLTFDERLIAMSVIGRSEPLSVMFDQLDQEGKVRMAQMVAVECYICCSLGSTGDAIQSYPSKSFPQYNKLLAIFVEDTTKGLQENDVGVKVEDVVPDNQIIPCASSFNRDKEIVSSKRKRTQANDLNGNRVESKVVNQGTNAANDTMSKVASQMKDLPRLKPD
nr:hypothetical protein CTI12_AA046200 [Tanacetum cinerariifolium]